MINTMVIKNIIAELCSVNGVSGDEKTIFGIVEKYLKENAEISVDSNGNFYAVLGNKSADKTVLLDAHLDRIGFVVTDIDDNGFVKVDKCGGIDIRTLQDSELVTDDNISGVICCMPPHISSGNADKATPISKVWVDFGMPADEIKKYIKIGDSLTFKSNPIELLNSKIASPALDNRCSVATLILCADILKDKELDYKVVILLSSQEETYGTGAKTGAYKIDADEAIVVDVSFASQPDISGQYSKIELEKGPMICISPILNRSMSDKLIYIAKNNDIPYQLEPISGRTGTNADHISVTKSGVKTSVVSIPQRYMHTQTEVISVKDVENTARLICEYIMCGGAFND